MIALIIGYGSMGRRRARLLLEIERDIRIVCVDNNPGRVLQIEDAGFTAYSNVEDAISEQPDIAFVCTSPGHHAEIILKLVDAGIHTFTELNLTDDRYDEIESLAEEKQAKVFVSSTPLYKKEIEKVKSFILHTVSDKPLFYSLHVGQYLPDWHPWEDYKDFFVSDKDTSGIREIYAVQLPWIIDVFGKVKNVTSEAAKLTGLSIEYPDCVSAILRHDNGNVGIFVVDVASRSPISHLEIVGEDVLIVWDGHKDDLYIYDFEDKLMKPVNMSYGDLHIDGYADNITEVPYKEEILDFLAMIKNDSNPRYSLKKDRYILSIIDKIEGRSDDKREGGA